MKKSIFAVLLLLVLAFLPTAGLACSSAAPSNNYPYPPGGMMGGPGGWMGPGGMMGGPRGTYRPGQTRITIDQAIQTAQSYLSGQNNADLKITEVMEFDYNFYIDLAEKSTGVHAFEALIDPYTSDMYPEPGPNMMWNAKYGMMSGMIWGLSGQNSAMTVSGDQATRLAQQFIDSYVPGGKVNEPERFYGYYTFDFSLNGNIYGMLSVNGYTGQVWYHSWHGAFRGEKQVNP